MAGKKLLVADDSLTIQKVIRLALSNEGYEIQAVSDGNDAIEQIPLFQPDVVLIDISLPSRSAFEVKRIINEHSHLAHTRFVLMSSAFEKVDEDQAREVVFHGRLTKPFDPGHLRQVLTETLSTVGGAPAASPRPSPAKGRAPARPPAPAMAPPPPLPEPPASEDDWSSLGEPSAPPPPPDNDDVSGDDLWEREMAVPASRPAKPTFAPPSAPPLQTPGKPRPLAFEDGDFATIQPDPAPELDSPGSSDDSVFSPTPTPRGGESDIRHLTESTIRMSGLDDFQWSVKEPSLKPPSESLDHGDASFPIGNPTPHSVMAGPGDSEDPGHDDFIQPPAPRRPMAPPPSSRPNPPLPPSSAPSSSSRSSAPANPGVVVTDEMIRKQVEEAVEKMARKLLPEVAERVIKQEIHRLLSEQS